MDAISERLDRKMPGLKGISARNLRNMRTFYEDWVMSVMRNRIWQMILPKGLH